MKELVRPNTPGGSPLVRDYLAGSPATAGFFNGSPYLLRTFRAKLDEVTLRFDRAARQTAAAAVEPLSDRGKERLQRFVEQGGAMVTTGQQAGFLTGPLYTIHKAVSAIVLARHLEERLGILVLPVFWIASEDHDWLEVNHASLLDRKGRLRRFELPSSDPRPLPMSHRRLEGDLDSLCDDILHTVGAARNNTDYVKEVLAAYRTPGTSVADAFRGAFRTIFAGSDLLLTDAADPTVKGASRRVLRAALEDSPEHEAVLSRRSDELEAAGYRPQVNVLEGATNVFFLTESGRFRVYRRGADYALREERRRLNGEELLGTLEADPGLFSPNVFLRPVVESAVFPTLAYVGGPGEIAYFAQVSALFEAYGIRPPAVVPRFSGVIVEPAVERVLEELGLDLARLATPKEALVEQLAQAALPPAVREALDGIRQSVAGGFERLIDEAIELDPTLAGPLGSIRNREQLWTAVAERKILRAIKRGDRIAFDRLDRVLDALRPEAAPQERVLNVLPYLGRYGGYFLRELDRVVVESWRMPL